MELSREQPPAYVSHNPEDLKLPSVPQQDLKPAQTKADLTLPNLQSVLANLPEQPPDLRQHSYGLHHASRSDINSQASDRTYTRTNGAFRPSHESAIISPSDTMSVASADGINASSTSVVSLEDPDVRLAAEALSGLGNPGYARSANAHPATMSQLSPTTSQTSRQGDQEPEPLLELLVDAHPWLGGTINGSLSAYTMTKNYSPRFVKYSADLIERNIGYPMVNTVTNVGKRTGVEGGIRRYLGGQRPSDMDRAHTENKRRRVDPDAMDVDSVTGSTEGLPSSRRQSQDFLPAYRGSKPPSYREEASPSSAERQQMRTRPHDRGWGTKLMISTSGLGVALSESSLRSLTYCVSLLTNASEHVATVMDALKMLLRDFDRAQESRQREQARRAKEVEAGFISREQAQHDDAARQLADRIKQLCDDIWQTMKTVVNSISTYAGAALPDNARRVVKSQLMSVPQRWRLASETAAKQDQQDSIAEQQSSVHGETRKTAHRMIAFAEEGLDMMAQVNGVVKITLQSAEDWLRTLGRRNQTSDEQMHDGQEQLSFRQQ